VVSQKAVLHATGSHSDTLLSGGISDGPLVFFKAATSNDGGEQKTPDRSR
jgi:hypothetical protein